MAAKHLLESWEELERDLAERFLYLFLDYDGTLSPIVRDPGRALLSLRMKERLEKMLRIGRCRIAVISGRSLEDIRKRVGIVGITYGGNHGLEVEGPEGKFQYPIPEKVMRALDDVRGAVEKALSTIPGTFLEEKGMTLTIHLRKVKRSELPVAAHAVSEATRPYRMREEIVLRSGKEVCEVRPFVAWDKGKTVLWLLKKGLVDGGEVPWPVCVGDDRTDEDTFRTIRDKGLTVFVGEAQTTEARYYLRNIGEVAEFLGRLARIRKG